VLDRAGADLLTQQVVTLVNVSPTADVNAVAALLNPIDGGITAKSLQAQLTAANGQPVTAMTLRAAPPSMLRADPARAEVVAIQYQSPLSAWSLQLRSR